MTYLEHLRFVHYHRSLKRPIRRTLVGRRYGSSSALGVGVARAKGIVVMSPSMPSLVSTGARNRRVLAEGPVDDEAPKPIGNKLDLELWFPPKKVEYPQATPKVAHERPTGGTITITSANKNFHLIQPPVDEVEGGTTEVIKFGSFGGNGGDSGGRCHGHTTAASDSAQRSQPKGTNVMTVMLMICKSDASQSMSETKLPK